MPLSYQQALDYIHSFDDPYLAALRNHGKQTWGLDQIKDFLDKLGRPHLAYPTVHVAGTKGKGSTAAFITQALIEAGLKTGLYISPHLQDWRERIQINRIPISEQELARLVEDFQPFVDDPSALTAFEVTTVLAFWHFARQACDVAVIEVGLGGRLDATNVVRPLVSVITNVSLDHTQLLGNTLEQIAAEKAAIIKPGVPVVSGPQAPEALAVIRQRAAEHDNRLVLAGRERQLQIISMSWRGSQALIGREGRMEPYIIGLPGTFQVENAAVALAALKELRLAGLPLTPQAITNGLGRVRWPGRLELLSRDPLLVIDSAHNTYSLQELLKNLAILAPHKSLTCLFGCMADKDSDGMLRALLPVVHRLGLLRSENPRAADPEVLAEQARSLLAQGAALDNRPEIAVLGSDMRQAIRWAIEHMPSDGLICVTGSLALAGEARTVWFERSWDLPARPVVDGQQETG